MNEPRFYCPNVAAGTIELDEHESRHALLSLRLRPGDPLLLFDGHGRLGQGRLLPFDAHPAAAPDHARPPHASRRRGERKVGKAKANACARVAVDAVLNVPRPSHQLTLVAAASKGHRLDWMIEKCTELGVDRILLTTFERSVVRPEPDAFERLHRLAVAACKQCRRAWLPEFEIAASLPAALARADPGDEAAHKGAAPGGALLIADPQEGAAYLAAWLHGHAPLPARLAVVIGPEGGLTDAERERLRTAGGQPIRLGDYILRIETAAVCVAANWAVRRHD